MSARRVAAATAAVTAVVVVVVVVVVGSQLRARFRRSESRERLLKKSTAKLVMARVRYASRRVGTQLSRERERRRRWRRRRQPAASGKTSDGKQKLRRARGVRVAKAENWPQHWAASAAPILTTTVGVIFCYASARIVGIQRARARLSPSPPSPSCCLRRRRSAIESPISERRPPSPSSLCVPAEFQFSSSSSSSSSPPSPLFLPISALMTLDVDAFERMPARATVCVSRDDGRLVDSTRIVCRRRRCATRMCATISSGLYVVRRHAAAYSFAH